MFLYMHYIRAFEIKIVFHQIERYNLKIIKSFDYCYKKPHENIMLIVFLTLNMLNHI